MADFSITIRLDKIDGCFPLEVTGKTRTKRGWFIPVEDCDIWENDKGAASISFWANASAEARFGESHNLRVALKAEHIEAYKKEKGVQYMPFCGSMKEVQRKRKDDGMGGAPSAGFSVNAPSDLPF